MTLIDFLDRSLLAEVTLAIHSGRFNALAFVGLDNFAAIISELGIPRYELFLGNLVTSLKSNISAEIFEISLDRLLIVTNVSQIEQISRSILDCAYSNVGDCCLHIDERIGYVIFDCYDAELVVKAFIALKLAKDYGKRLCCYNQAQELMLDSRERMRGSHILMDALYTQKAELFCQPIVWADSLSLYCCEGLLRILDGNSAVSAGRLIGHAEAMGLAMCIDELVLENALFMLHSNPELHLSINISAQTACDELWLGKFIRLVGATDLNKRMIIEITETAEIRDRIRLLHFIQNVRESGIRVAMDDFGTGNTSFSNLANFPMDLVKISGEFIKNVVKCAQNRRFVQIVVDLAHNAGIKVVAEMVEEQGQVDVLRELGVDLLQGDLIGKPATMKTS